MTHGYYDFLVDIQEIFYDICQPYFSTKEGQITKTKLHQSEQPFYCLKMVAPLSQSHC